MSKEIQQIIEKLRTLGPDEKAVLATVVDVKGSSYRLPGAKMLITGDDRTFGTVSGGCLEADVLERAKKVRETGEAAVFTYDTTKDENSVFGLNMGCRGIIRILLEPIEKDDFYFYFVEVGLKRRHTGKVAVLIDPIKPHHKIGTRIFQDELNFSAHQLSFDEILEIKDFPETEPTVADFSFGEVFIETIRPPLNLFVFGAGFDALPLIKFGKELGWRVSVIDHRPAYADQRRLPEADEIIVAQLDDLTDDLFKDENFAAVVMTHHYEKDREILSRLLGTECLYIGALGPKRRAEKIIYELTARGEFFTDEQLRKLHAPAGLDIGADTPEAIALAIVAEIQAVLKNREGGFLRKREGSIYGRGE